MNLTPTELTILGLVVEQPRHGYELEQVIEDRGIRQWTDIGFSSIYYVLTRLEKRGLIGAEEERTGARSRRVFRATPLGRAAAAEQALALVAGDRPTPNPFLVGLANTSLLTDADYRAALRARAATLDARIASVAHAERSQAPLPDPAREIFSYTLTLLRAERMWLAERVDDTHD